MLWIFTVFICVVSAKTCEVDSEREKVIQPHESVNVNNATFLSSSKIGPAEECHKGCCDTAHCDTSFHTGSLLNKEGDNCFYFECNGKCVFEAAAAEEAGNFSVAHVTATRASVQHLPDFSGMNLDTEDTEDDNNTDGDDSAGSPDSVPDSDNEVQVVENDNMKSSGGTQDNSSPDSDKPDTDQKIGVIETPHEETSGDESDDQKSNDEESNEDLQDGSAADSTGTAVGTDKSDEPAQTGTTTVDSSDKTDIKEEEEEKAEDGDKNDFKQEEKDNVEVDDDTDKTAESANTDESSQSVDVDKPAETDESVEEEKVELEDYVKRPTSPPTHKESGTSKSDTLSNANTTVVDSEQPENEMKPDDKPENSTDLKVEINIDNEAESGYTVKDVVFWVSVVGGSALILFGVVTIVVVYRNKRRRLYSSLTDDYLINGMYSI